MSIVIDSMELFFVLVIAITVFYFISISLFYFVETLKVLLVLYRCPLVY